MNYVLDHTRHINIIIYLFPGSAMKDLKVRCREVEIRDMELEVRGREECRIARPQRVLSKKALKFYNFLVYT